MHVLVDEDPLVAIDAAAEKPDEIPVLELGNQLDLVLEFAEPLDRRLGEPLHGDFLSIRQLTLQGTASHDGVNIRILSPPLK